MFKQYFPNTPVFSMYGNHGAYPVNVLDMTNMTWLNVPFANAWGQWLPSDSKQDMATLGFYSLIWPGTNLKIIAINSQACNNLNFYLFANVTDPAGHIPWIQNELNQAELNGQMVYIFGHIPTSSGDCLDVWAAHMNTLVDRYSHIIAGQFYGHAHSEHWHLARSAVDGRVTSIQWGSPSVTTYQGINPSFRVYEADPVTFEIVDYHQHRMNMTTANQNPGVTPVFELAYSFKEYFGVPDLTLGSLFNLVNNFMVNETSALMYLYNENTGY